MSTAAPRPIAFAAGGDAEELARAEVYGLLAALFYAPPSVEMQAQFQVAVTQAPVAGAFLEHAWGELVGAVRRLPRDEIGREFDRLFQGVGKPELFLYGSFYIAGKLNEKPLVALRHSLRALGLAKNETTSETEDHIASLCEVMRYLIAGGDAQTSNLAAQRRFFDAHLRPWVGAMCSAIEAHAEADFYAALARFAADFFAVEGQAFDLLDS
ncbi:MAG TPA: molecular chaperone TorD family protein [Caldimonas sp.]